MEEKKGTKKIKKSSLTKAEKEAIKNKYSRKLTDEEFNEMLVQYENRRLSTDFK